MPLGYNIHLLLTLIVVLPSIYYQTRAVSETPDIPEVPAVSWANMHNPVTKEFNSNAHLTGAITQRLPQIPLDVEKYPVAPSELELEQVHVFVRHGESSSPTPKAELNTMRQASVLPLEFV